MSGESSIEAVAPNLNLGPEEKRVYGQLFRQADSGSAGIVTGEDAVKFFEKTRLDSRVLGEIWQIADKENRGFLTPAGFGIVLRLIGHAQAGREPTPQIAMQQAPIPRFETFAAPPGPPPGPPPGHQAAAAPIQAQGTGGPLRIPPLTPDKVVQFGSLFERQNLSNGMLPGDQIKGIFEKSGLPNDALGRIWQLADTEQRGSLVQAEFVIAMHLLTSMRSGALRALPNVLPAPLYEAATRRGSNSGAPRQSPQNTGISAIPRQMSGNAQVRTSSPLGRPPIGPPPMGPQVTGGDWAVTPADKQRFDQIYTDLDKQNKGYITGEEAVPFLSQSNLAEDALAQIWDLADVLSRGQLTRDEFAVAMFLIRQQRGGRNTLPSTLPSNLIPPNLRQQVARSQNAGASAFDDPTPIPQQQQPPRPPPQPKSALDDLFGLDSGPSSPAPPAQNPMSTGGSNADPFASGIPSQAPASPIRATNTGNQFKNFVPSSSFGRGLVTQPTGSQTGGDDLLDADDQESKKINNDSTELANLSNQVSSLSKQMQDTQSKRAGLQHEANQTNSQKANFEQRLAQLRTAYEKEAEDTRVLEEQLRKSRADTQKLQSECFQLEQTYKDVQTQHQEMSGALQADKQENTNLRERIRVVNAEITQLKPQIEKLKSEARQQKGLVAINKKQLSTTEGEREKLKTESDDLAKASEEASRQIQAASVASPPSQVVSPALSTSSANNPFFKRSASTDIMGAFASPPPRNYNDKSFDDVFGPSFAAASATAPPAAFKQQHTGASTASIGSHGTPPTGSPVISRQATLAAEPPAPPVSMQMSSSFLPLPDQSESLSSSRQVSPPASRGEGSIPDTQSSFPDPAVADKAASVPGAFPGEDKIDEATPGAVTPIPNAFDGEKAIAGEQSDPFGGNDQAKAKAEFDNAFAAFSSAKTQPKETPEASRKPMVNTEFPPISELERDDSDSDSEQGGFEDDFSPRLPPQANKVDVEEPEAPAVPEKEVNKGFDQPSSPATVTDSNAHTIAQNSAVDDIFGSATTGTLPSISQPVPSNPPTSKGAFGDDDDFEGLEDAKEGSADDDFANVPRSAYDDFNPVFDSSPSHSQAKSESTAFGNESSFDFVNSTSSSGAPAPASGNQQKGADNHDWDAIFAGLDSSNATTPQGTNELMKGPVGGDLGLAPPDHRPAPPGRALTEAGEHDDPIVKNLTSMGYSRLAAVSALEKYDYDLEKAANHLASSS